MKFQNVKNIDDLLKKAIPQDMTEEMHPYMKSKETGKFIFPDQQLKQIINDLKEFIYNHEESGMVSDVVIKKSQDAYYELLDIWSDLSDEARGEGWSIR